MYYLDDFGVKKVKADVLAFFENFSSDTYSDSAKSSGVWDTALGQAYLPSNVWAGISEEYVGYESLTGFPTDSVRQQFVLDSNNNAYLVWQDYAGIISYVYFSKFIEGQGWLKMDNTPGYEQIAEGSVPRIYLAPDGTVYILWGVWGPQYKVQITKWVEGVGWAKMDGTPGIETIYSNTEGGGDPMLKFDNNNRPVVTFPGNNRLLFTRWDGSMWTKMNGTSGYDDLFEGGMNLREFAIDELNNPYITWEGFDMSDPFNYYQTVNFTKWNGSTWTGADGIDRDGEPNTFENDVLIKLPDMADNLFPQVKLDNNNYPLVSWVRSKVYFSKWNGSTWTGADNIDDDGNPSTYNYDMIDPGADFVSEHSMLLDSNNYPVIVFSESLNNDVALTRWNGVTWTGADKIDHDNNPGTFEYEDVSNTVGWSMAGNFVIDSADRIHVVWLENVNNVNVYIYFTYWDGVRWAKLSENVPGKEELFSGIYPSANPPNIKLDSESNPYVFFDSWRGSVGGIYVTKMVTDYIRNASVFSLNVNQTSDYVSIASLKPDEVLFGQSINYFLSNNGGATWTSVLPNLPYLLPSVGNDLRWKADFHTGNKKITPQLLGLNIINKTTDFACWVDDPINMGASGKIYAKIKFPATQVRAKIVNDSGDIIRDNILLTTSNGTDYNGDFLVNSIMYASRNIVVLANDTTTNQQTFCNASTGREWNQVLNQNLSQADKKADLISFNNKLWLIGGIKNNVLTNEVFSSVDGQNWICEWGNSVSCNHPAPGWSARWGNKLVVYNNNIWLIGGCVSYDSTFSNCAAINRKNDVWSFDGNTWLLKTASANFSSRFEMAVAEYDNKMWVLGGRDNNNLNDVWYSTDGISWTSAPMANWPGRYSLNAVNYDNGSGNRLWVIGGRDNVGSKTDVWAANNPLAIDNWQQITSNGGWGSRYGYNFINYDERLIILGGCDISGVFNGICDSSSYLNDIWWSIDGENWAQIIPTQAWPARFLASAGIFNNHIYIRAGQAASGPLNDLWQSDYGYFSFTIRESGGSIRYPEPSNFMCKGMTHSSITWSFQDNTSDEAGFILYNFDPQGISSVNKVINSQNLSEINESNLSANTLYRGFITAYKSSMESSASNTDSCYTLANNPQAPIVTPVADGINIIINRADGNPDYTEYALFEYYSNKYVQPDSTLGTEAYWAKYPAWGGAAGINVSLRGNYQLYILAKNVAGKISGYNAAALNLGCKAQNATEIEWQMSAPSFWELDGFNLYKLTADQSELVTTTAAAGSKSNNYTESKLQPNSQYSRYFKTYKVAAEQKTESEASITATCFTLANEPLPIRVVVSTEDSVQLFLNNGDGNPPETLYAIYEAKSGLYVQADGSLGSEPFWQTYEQWGGANGIYVKVLGAQVSGQFRISLAGV
ncbi:MAG: hypothetical protein NTX82_03140, partial [Candidatus Parcubacteria bacterium]|nr:hypothetical protein [Candidatus Parcubacteria bacterium]